MTIQDLLNTEDNRQAIADIEQLTREEKISLAESLYLNSLDNELKSSTREEVLRFVVLALSLAIADEQKPSRQPRHRKRRDKPASQPRGVFRRTVAPSRLTHRPFAALESLKK